MQLLDEIKVNSITTITGVNISPVSMIIWKHKYLEMEACWKAEL